MLPNKNNITIYKQKELTARRQELLDRITKHDSYLPDSILHDDLDYGMLEFVKEYFKVTSDGEEIPIIPKILTVQRWGEITNNWSFSNEDGNLTLPFISVIRKPDVQPGTNPIVQRTIPDRKTFFYSSVPTWNGTQLGANIYKIPQPVPVDIGYDVTIVCQKFRDLNRFNRVILEKFASRQSYTSIKGHYIPLILDKNGDSSPIDIMDGRRFYLQTYSFIMLGFLIDSEEFEVKPAINRMLVMTEFIDSNNFHRKVYDKGIETVTTTFIADGVQTAFSVGEPIGFLFYVAINGLTQERDVDYFFIPNTSKVIFETPPPSGWLVAISYFPGMNITFFNNYGVPLYPENEFFPYDGSSLTFTVSNIISNVIHLEINGLIDEENVGFSISGLNQVTLLAEPVVGSTIGICYIHQ